MSTEIITAIIGSSVLSIPLGYILGGRTKNNADVLEKITKIYSDFTEHYKARLDEAQKEIHSLKIQNTELQKQFNDIHLHYAKEVEKSQNWEKLHRQLLEKYNVLNSKYEALEKKYTTELKNYGQLKKDHEKLKKEFENYKKANE